MAERKRKGVYIPEFAEELIAYFAEERSSEPNRRKSSQVGRE
jgi:hypothetical protein